MTTHGGVAWGLTGGPKYPDLVRGLVWSVIEADDSNAAVRLMEDHPFISRGGILQLSEPI